ncbi:MAG TPA: hypothetical protein VN516_09475 [Candidatus Baltobacteraceae bacterium]|nr:hypothetical protein [Candidatus Baltobacteraceae bacterium]
MAGYDISASASTSSAASGGATKLGNVIITQGVGGSNGGGATQTLVTVGLVVAGVLAAIYFWTKRK